MSGVKYITIIDDETDMRLDRWFRKYYAQLSYGQLEALLRKGLIRVDGKRAKASYRLIAGEKIRIPPEAQSSNTLKENRRKTIPAHLISAMKNSILHYDDDIMLLNKPSGLAVQGGSKTDIHIDAILPELRFGADEPPRLVHRLDRDTSGLLLLARNRRTASYLTRLFAQKKIEKSYWGLVYGVPRPAEGVIRLPLIKRAARQGKERVVPAEKGEEGAQSAHTEYRLIAQAGQKYAWLAFRPHTGRTHQIRVHMQAIGHSLVGDKKYSIHGEMMQTGGVISDKLHLHNRIIRFIHPNGKLFSWQAPLTDHMAKTWQYFEFADDEERAGKIFDEIHRF